MVWKPRVTVAAIIEQDQRFLLVEEETPMAWNLTNLRAIWNRMKI